MIVTQSKYYRILLTAFNQIGVIEIPGEPSNPIINEYLKTVRQPGDDEIPWCAAFVNWVLLKNNIVGPGKPNARSFETYGWKAKERQLGQIVVFQRGSQSWMGHVGFDVGESTHHIILLSGNQNNEVCIMPYLKSTVIARRDYL